MFIVTLFCCWLFGIWLASMVRVPTLTGIVLSLACFAVGLLFRNQRQRAILLTCVGMILLGGVRFQFAVPVINTHHIAFYNDNLTVNIKGTVIDEPDIRDRFVQLRVRVDEISLPDGEETAVSGTILVQAFRYPEIAYGDELLINGRLSTPPEEGEFNYRAYLAQQGIHAIVTFPNIQVIAQNQANPVRRQILNIKQSARQAINQAIVDPQAALLIGILLGDDNGLPEHLDNDFQTTGMTHIIAISGFNISIIIWVLLAMGRAVFIPKRHRSICYDRYYTVHHFGGGRPICGTGGVDGGALSVCELLVGQTHLCGGFPAVGRFFDHPS